MVSRLKVEHKVNFKRKFILRLSEHPLLQNALCDCETELNPKELLDIMQELEANGFTELICILLLKHRHSCVLDHALSSLTAELIAQKWEGIGPDALCASLRQRIRREAAHHRERIGQK